MLGQDHTLELRAPHCFCLIIAAGMLRHHVAITHYSSKGLFFVRKNVTLDNSHPTGEIEKLGFFNQVAEEIARRLDSKRANDRPNPTEAFCPTLLE